MRRGVAVAGTIAVALVLAFALRLTPLLQWAEDLARPYKEGVDLWIGLATLLTAAFTVALAAATVVMARATSDSVRAAVSLAEAEDTRHQQKLGPILLVEPLGSSSVVDGFAIRNVGLGPAQNVYLMMRGRCSGFLPSGDVDELRDTQDAPRAPSDFDVEFYATRTIIEARADAPWAVRLSESGAFRNVEMASDVELVAVLSYFDIFTNEYRTATQDPLEVSEMVWLRPQRLFPQRTNIEKYLDVHSSPEDLLEALRPTRISVHLN